jgi:hypothetical protein
MVINRLMPPFYHSVFVVEVDLAIMLVYLLSYPGIRA